VLFKDSNQLLSFVEKHMTEFIKYLPAEKRRSLTVDTVIALAAEQNPRDITTAVIARRMGMTQGSIFRHFPSNDAIFEAVMEWVADRLMSRIEKAARAQASPLAALESMFLTHVDFVAEYPGIPRILFGELQHAQETAPKRMAQTLIQRYRKQLFALIEQGKSCGEIDGHIHAETSATLFIGIIQGLVMQSMLGGDVSRIRHEAPQVFAIFKRGIRSLS
jgi:TetR/AcrR family transcriptional regulator